MFWGIAPLRGGFAFGERLFRYPAAGNRYYGYGTLHSIGYSGFSWSTSVSTSSANAHLLGFDATVVIPQNSHYHASSFPVRCLQE